MKKSTLLITAAVAIVLSWLCFVQSPLAEDKLPEKAVWEYKVRNIKDGKQNHIELEDYLAKESQDSWEYCGSVREFSTENRLIFRRLKK